jgi:cardiolipin synthase
MKIIILGAGQVGGTLAENLAGENNDITIVDTDSERLRELQDKLATRTWELRCSGLRSRLAARFARDQHLFAADWMTESGEDIGHLLTEPLAVPEPGFAAQVIASGPTAYPAAAPEMFASLMFNARRELIVTTPYYVPVDSLQAALRAAANRGVDTTIIFPARNDDFAVKAASQSYYEDLLRAGVKIFEYHPGLLHAKTVTVDGEITLIGSANMDRRSFDLNYENNILLCDAAMTAAVRDRQMSYLADSRPVMQETVLNWSWRTRLWNNALAVVGPVL